MTQANSRENVIQLKAVIDVPTNVLIATDEVMQDWRWVKMHKQQLDLAKDTYDKAAAIMKAHMGEYEILASNDGALLATYKQQASYMALDKDAVKNNFADVYDVCLIEHSGNRPFCLK